MGMKKQFAVALLSCTAMSWANPALAQDTSGPPATGQTTPEPAAQAAQAAQAAPAQGAAPRVASAEAGQIVVTGTRIVRNGYTAPTPVTVATTEELSRTTPSSIPD